MTEKDNVATAIADIESGEEIDVEIGKPKKKVKVKQDIAFGHKFALSDIAKESDVIKYGEIIGKATADIGGGMHVHVHNVESLRGRGDLVEKG